MEKKKKKNSMELHGLSVDLHGLSIDLHGVYKFHGPP
jgi:hypothetical protein